MIRCYAQRIDDGGREFYHISRAYRPSEVFVYQQEGLDGGLNKMYLENLSTHVGIVHELYNFGDVEI